MTPSKRRTITALLAGLLLALLLACAPADISQEEAYRQCREDPQCHPAPPLVDRAWRIEQREQREREQRELEQREQREQR
jgi:hypothetical protein